MKLHLIPNITKKDQISIIYLKHNEKFKTNKSISIFSKF